MGNISFIIKTNPTSTINGEGKFDFEYSILIYMSSEKLNSVFSSQSL